MLSPLPPAVYRCIIPVKKARPDSSAVYHSSADGQSWEAPQEPYFLAWPDIDPLI
jgi:hypothetical protein